MYLLSNCVHPPYSFSYSYIRAAYKSISIISDTSELEAQIAAAKDEMAFHADVIESLIAENARIAQDQTEYNKKYQLAMERYEAAKAAYDSIIAQKAEKNKRIQRMQAFINNVRDLGVITEFDEELWGLLVERVTVYGKDDVKVEFKK